MKGCVFEFWKRNCAAESVYNIDNWTAGKFKYKSNQQFEVAILNSNHCIKFVVWIHVKSTVDPNQADNILFPFNNNNKIFNNNNKIALMKIH